MQDAAADPGGCFRLDIHANVRSPGGRVSGAGGNICLKCLKSVNNIGFCLHLSSGCAIIQPKDGKGGYFMDFIGAIKGFFNGLAQGIINIIRAAGVSEDILNMISNLFNNSLS